MVYRYRTQKKDGRTHLVHRIIMEHAIGRKLHRTELIHHKNGDRMDNRIENLEITTPKEHSIHHNQKHPISKTCSVCGGIFIPHPTKRARQKTCSWDCRNRLISQRRAGATGEARP